MLEGWVNGRAVPGHPLGPGRLPRRTRPARPGRPERGPAGQPAAAPGRPATRLRVAPPPEHPDARGDDPRSDRRSQRHTITGRARAIPMPAAESGREPGKLVEGAAGDPLADLVADSGEQAAQGLLGVPVGPFQVRVVISPQHVAVTGRRDHLDRALVVLERGVDLLADDLAGQPAQLGPDEHAVLPVRLVHPVPDGGYPRGAALGDQDAQAGVTVQGPPATRCDTTRMPG